LKNIFPGLLILLISIVLVLPAAAPVRAESDNVTPPAPVGIPSLMVKVANTIQAGQPATITVYSRRSNETIAGATIYAIKTNSRAGAAGPGNSTTRDSEFEDSGESDGIQFEALTRFEGMLIGTTGDNGTVSATLAGVGRYLLIATKDGYIPGFARMQVKAQGPKARLNLKAPAPISAGQQAIIGVTDSISGQATENATVYALKVEKNKDIKPMPPAANSSKAVIGLAGGDADKARQNGVLVGSTDSAGQVSYSFPTAGQYFLAAFKAGYIPANARINILQAAALTPVPVPQAATAPPVQVSPQQVSQSHGNGEQSHGDEVEDD
jgi:hypothetical protein